MQVAALSAGVRWGVVLAHDARLVLVSLPLSARLRRWLGYVDVKSAHLLPVRVRRMHRGHSLLLRLRLCHRRVLQNRFELPRLIRRHLEAALLRWRVLRQYFVG